MDMDIKWVMILQPPRVHQRIFALIYGSPVVYIYIFFFCEGAGTHILKHSDSYIRDPGGGKIYKEVHTTPPPEIRKSIQDPGKHQI